MKTTYPPFILAALSCLSLGFTLVLNAEDPIAPATENVEPPSALPLPEKKTPEKKASIQLAILLDTSSSMNGLINQARTYLWKIVNEMTLARHQGKLPHIQIAIYEYGNNSLSAKNNYIRQVLPLSDDLDSVSEALFKLTTNGGEEYCGAVIEQAVNQLAWNETDKEALKIIVIAGNEPFSQGSISPEQAIKKALAKGITVNTILCGIWDPDKSNWEKGALRGDGSFAMIDQNKQEIIPETPHDKALAQLNTELNATYIAYGSKMKREISVQKQADQDINVTQASPSAFADRIKAKSSKTAYRNSAWDIIDAMEESAVPLSFDELAKNDQLPDELKGKSEEEIKKIISEKAEKRKAAQKQIKELSEKRDQWLVEYNKKATPDSKEKSLNDAIIDSLHKQAAKKNFNFTKENNSQPPQPEIAKDSKK